MPTEYIVSKNEEKTLGITGLSKNVFESIAALCIEEVDDVKIAPTGKNYFSKPVSCKVVKDNIVMNLNILISSGVNINEISNIVQEKVHEAIYFMTNIKNVIVNVNVVGFFLK